MTTHLIIAANFQNAARAAAQSGWRLNGTQSWRDSNGELVNYLTDMRQLQGHTERTKLYRGPGWWQHHRAASALTFAQTKGMEIIDVPPSIATESQADV